VHQHEHHPHCFVPNSEWIPVLTHEPIEKAMNAEECQVVCGRVEECHHFTFWPNKDCSLHGENARLISGAAATGTITGPADCTTAFTFPYASYSGGTTSSLKAWMVWALLAMLFGTALVVILVIVVYQMFFDSDRKSDRRRGRHRRIVDMDDSVPNFSGTQTEVDAVPQYITAYRPASSVASVEPASYMGRSPSAQTSQQSNARSVQMAGRTANRSWS